MHDTAPRSTYGRWARRHHFHHHFHNPALNSDVTTPLWDILLGTHHAVRDTMRVPRGMAMPWLLDAMGQVHSHHAGAYRLR